MDSRDLADRVAESFNGEVPLLEGNYGMGVNIHAIVRATLDELAAAGFIDLEQIDP